MSLTKEQYLDYLEEEAEFYAEGYEAIKKLINEHFELVENFKQLEKNYDDLYDEKENTIGFKHFRLLADSTLKSQNKEYLLDYIHMLYRNWKISDTGYNDMMNYASVLQNEVRKYKDHNIELMNYIAQIERGFKDNPSLKFEELKENMWVWDNHWKLYIQIQNLNENAFQGYEYYAEFEENRFYRREVK